MYVGVNDFGGAVANVTGELRAFRNGVEIADSPLTPLNSGTSFTAPETPDRAQLDQTLNFAFPASWLAAGDLTIEATVNQGQTIAEATYGNNTQSYQLTFNSVDPLAIVLVPIAFQPGGQGPIYRPTLDASTKFGLGYLKELYPIPDINYTVHSEYAFTGDLYSYTGWATLLSEIRQLRNSEVADPSAPFPKYYGVVSVEPGCCYPGTLSPWPAVGGIGYVPGSASVGLESTGMIIDFNGDGIADSGYPNPYITLQEHIAAHEVGHNLGLGHAPCGTTGEATYPNTTAEIEDVGFYLPTFSLIPSTYHDIMSYCFTSSEPTQWVSVYNYQRLFNGLVATNLRAATVSGQGEQSAWLIAGSVRSNGTVGTLYNTRPIVSHAVVTDEGQGPYEIRVVNAQNYLLYRHAFTPEAIQSEDDEEKSIHQSTVESGALWTPLFWTGAPAHYEVAVGEDGDFSFLLPYNSAATRIELWRGDTLLDTLPVAANPPMLSASHTDQGDTITVNWSASDDDPNYPTLSLRYSADLGKSWQTLVHNLPTSQTSFVIDKAQLTGSPAGLIEVMAGNSTLSTETQLEIGAISNKTPKVAIEGLRSRLYRPGESLVLFGSAIDFEDGTVPPESFTWTIDGINGITMAGRQFTLIEGLSAGTYTVRLRVVDTNGAATERTVTVAVGYQLYLPTIRR